MWSGHLTALRKAAQRLPFLELVSASPKAMQNPAQAADFLANLSICDCVVLFHSTDAFWQTYENEFNRIMSKVPTVVLGYDPTYFGLSGVDLEIAREAFRYVSEGGASNFEQLLRYLAAVVCKQDIAFTPPQSLPREGIYHPDADTVFADTDTYLAWRRYGSVPLVGILFSRFRWVNGNVAAEDALVRALERRGLGCIPVFTSSVPDKDAGAKGAVWATHHFLIKDATPRVDLLLKLLAFPFGGDEGIRLFKEVGVPVLSPVFSSRKSIEEWENDPEGLTSEVGWTVVMPEFEGCVEPLFLAGVGERSGDEVAYSPSLERVERVAERIEAWVRLRKKPPEKRRVAFILHNNPCAGVEMSVGGGAGLDAPQSVAEIIKAMRKRGYVAEDAPEDGETLIKTIMDRKAISEFRWTSVEEIVGRGGAVAQMGLEEYMEWFARQDERLRRRVVETWGNPPGEEKDGVPPAMLYQNRIVITGVRYGNILICVQPKRGCAGARCDGRVCRILHDPDIPPPHQYFATYYWIARHFAADVVVHVGTHGSLEFLPGKGVGLSAACCPDAAISTLPHLYIYNSDNPPEGIVAKRRSYATLIDHMQSTSEQSGLYGPLLELDRLLGEYEQARKGDAARAHTLQHLILDAIKAANLEGDVKPDRCADFDQVVRRAHETLALIRNSRTQTGLHIFGTIPQGRKKAEFIFSILRYDSGEGVSLCRAVAELMGFDFAEALQREGDIAPSGESFGQLVQQCYQKALMVVEGFLAGQSPADVLREIFGVADSRWVDIFVEIRRRVLDISARLEASDEVGALLKGFDGGYIEPGPAGLISRGRDDVLPTGRNFYSVDPHRVPTKAAWRVGVRLADLLIEKFRRENDGRFPETVALYWMASDIMWSDGEMMAQILHLLGARPVWEANGRLGGFEIVPFSELGRPRVDVTVRVSGILRDNFRNCMEFVDEVISAVAALDEPPEQNFVRKHTLERLKEADAASDATDAFRKATLRLFCSKPGTYGSGVNLAVYASAWKTETDLAAIFVHHNGYAYGKGVFGIAAHEALTKSLKSVDVTFNKVVSDDHDLFGCCCYFGTHGGLTVAARVASGRPVPAFYGDTRQPVAPKMRTLSEEVNRVVRTRLLHPRYVEEMRKHGYRGAQELAKRFGRVFGWQCSTGEVEGWVFDEVARRFALDNTMRQWFNQHNPWALEEMVRRLLEAHQRGLWQPDAQLLQQLQDVYMEVEGWLEERAGSGDGIQAGAVDVVTPEEVAAMQKAITRVRQLLEGARK